MDVLWIMFEKSTFITQFETFNYYSFDENLDE